MQQEQTNWAIDVMLENLRNLAENIYALKSLKFQAIKEAFYFHYENCQNYRNYCDISGFSPDELNFFEDLSKIPLLPLNVFKAYKVLSVDESEITMISKSSGTSQKFSIVYRDEITLRRLEKGLFYVLDQLVSGFNKGYVAMLIPPPDESDTWMVQILSRVFPKYFEDEDYFIKGGELDFKGFLQRLMDPGTPRPRHLFGPPFVLLKIAEIMKKRGIALQLDEGSIVSTGGGWKMYEGNKIDQKDFRQMISGVFGVPVENVRDGLNCTEINTWMIDCRCFYKHIPPWLHVTIRDPENPEKEVPHGEEGLIAYLDPLSNSYPAFVLTDDIGRLAVAEDQKCSCGMSGPCLHSEIRRASGAESKGCALKLSQYLSIEGNGRA
ncbi:MAG: hypothetical protein DRG59_12575 [Deltaproteobacteria bacterium]|nr:MAG: hypothetical protein DRG59_12575 [Deltaproteobacteria bacterium]